MCGLSCNDGTVKMTEMGELKSRYEELQKKYLAYRKEAREEQDEDLVLLDEEMAKAEKAMMKADKIFSDLIKVSSVVYNKRLSIMKRVLKVVSIFSAFAIAYGIIVLLTYLFGDLLEMKLVRNLGVAVLVMASGAILNSFVNKIALSSYKWYCHRVKKRILEKEKYANDIILYLSQRHKILSEDE